MDRYKYEFLVSHSMKRVMYVLLLCLLLPSTLAVTFCGVTNDEEFLVRDDLGNKVFSVGSDGNTIIYADSVVEKSGSVPPITGFKIYISGSAVALFTDSYANIVDDIIENSGYPDGLSPQFKIQTSADKAIFTEQGDLNVYGDVAYDGYASGCAQGSSCNVDGVTREYNALCDGSTGTCVPQTETCRTDSEDTDGGIDKFEYGTCTDYEGCPSGVGNCYANPSGPFADTCSSGDTLTEYYPSGGNCANTFQSCGNGYSCSGGECADCDVDNDGYCPLNDSPNDCYDANPSTTNAEWAYPGQTSYYKNNRGDGSFDYNCDGSETKDPSLQECLPGSGGPGYVGPSPPACGTSYTLYDGSICNTIVGSNTVPCR